MDNFLSMEKSDEIQVTKNGDEVRVTGYR